MVFALFAGAARAFAISTPAQGAIAAGGHHVLALKADGTVWSWGANDTGQLGTNDGPAREAPAPIAGLSSVAAIATGYGHSLALKVDGTVWAWGDNSFAQLGDGTQTNRTSPVQISGLSDVVAIAAGRMHSMALRADGTVWTWGANFFQQLGDGGFMPQSRPVRIASLGPTARIAASYYASAAVLVDGTVWRWGYSSSPDLPRAGVPTRVTGLPVIESVALGFEHLVARVADGSVWVVGANDYGQLGLGNTVGSAAVPIGVISNASSVVANTNSSFALLGDGSLRAWGSNIASGLGDGTNVNRVSPVPIGGARHYVAVAAGEFFGVALDDAGGIWQWGCNDAGQAGDGSSQTATHLVQLPKFQQLVAVSLSSKTGLALEADGSVWTARGEPVPGLGNVTSVAAGAYHFAARRTDGSVWMWGANEAGQLGDGTLSARSVPAAVTGLTGVSSVETGLNHTIALKSDGSILSWGGNGSGQLGDGTKVARSIPVATTTVARANAVSAGYNFSVAARDDGTVVRWGLNGTMVVPGLAGIVSLSAGNNHVLALKSDGTVWGVGDNTFGQLGGGTAGGYQNTATQVPGLSGIVEVAAGGTHSLARQLDGTVFGWGDNSRGQLGDGTTINRPSPIVVSPGFAARSIGAGDATTALVKSDGTLWVGGDGLVFALDAFALRQAAIRLVPSAIDSDQDGMLDAWEITQFGGLSHTGAEDSDGDGARDLRESQLGTDPSVADSDGDGMNDNADQIPNDYYDGTPPTLTIVGGNNQTAAPGAFVPLALDVGVWNSGGTSPLVNAPLTFTVTSGGGKLASNVGGPLADSITLRSDADGTGQVFYRQPSGVGVASSITAVAGLASVVFHASTPADGPGPDTDSDGLPDDWEQSHFGTVGANPAADADGDGLTNLQEYQAQTDPRRPHPGWAYFALPSNLIPLAASPNGVALLRDETHYWRWANGSLIQLAEYAEGVEIGPRKYRSTEAVLNRRGDVAIQTVDLQRPTSSSSDGDRTDEETAVTQVYPVDVTQPWSFAAPSLVAVSDFIDSAVYDVNGNFVRWSQDTLISNRLYSMAVGDDGALWGLAPVAVETYHDDDMNANYQGFIRDLVRVSAGGGGAVSRRARVGIFRGLDEQDHAIGQSGPDGIGFVGTSAVSYTPSAISASGQVIGYDGIATSYYPSGPQRVYAVGGNTGRLLPEADYPYYFDAQERINERAYTSNGFAHYLVTPTGPEGAWQRIAHVPLPTPAGWGSSHRMAVGGESAQLGYASINGGAPQPFLALPNPARLQVDNDRDGAITADLPDLATPEKPYRFWINDDIDRGHTVDGNDFEQDDISPAEAATNNWVEDWKYNTAQSLRDLEDFSRIVVSTSGLSDAFRNGDLYLGLKWVDTTGTPSIKLYKQYDATGGTSYLTDDYQASVQLPENAILNQRYPNDDVSSMSAHTVVTPGDLFVLPQGLWIGTTGDIKRSLLFEGCTAGTGQLKLVILKKDGTDYTEIGEGPGVWLDLKKIGDMYEHWSVGNSNGGAPNPVAGRIASLSGSGSAFAYTSSSAEEQKYILYVHGWNMEQWEKERYAETAYKRLWWQGYKGLFGLFSWPTTNGFTTKFDAAVNSTNFDQGEFTAWRSATPLRQLLQTLNTAHGGQLYVLSHSMGGIVTSEALRLQSDANGAPIVQVYVASQAAFSAHVYDGTLSDATGSPNALQWTYAYPGTGVAVNYGPQTPNIYRNWTAFVLRGSAVSSSSVNRVVNFYNENDYALSAPVWQFNQLTKPDFADYPELLWEYYYVGDFTGVPASDGFRKVGKYTNLSGEVILNLGNRTAVEDRYEIMSFGAESRVKAFGAMPNISQGISNAVDLQTLWLADPDNHSAHKWHSAEFRSTIQLERNYWKTLLSDRGFDISTVTLP